MDILLIVIVAVLGLVALVWLAGFVIPDHVTMKREAVIAAPRETVFGLISDFHNWSKWSPWAKRDPQAKYVIEGQGVGHSMAWTSEVREVGNGSQVITGLEAPSYMKSRLDFGSMGKADAVFTLSEVEGGTRVEWGFDTHMRDGVPVYMQPMAAYMGFMMEKWLAPDYEQGLASLKAAAEAESDPATPDPVAADPQTDKMPD